MSYFVLIEGESKLVIGYMGYLDMREIHLRGM